MLPQRILTGIAIVVDVALLARGVPVAAKTLAARQGRAPRHLEALLQDLVRHRLLKGTRGPRGGYELARERRRISLGDIVRGLRDAQGGAAAPTPSRLIEDVVAPALRDADAAFLEALDNISVQDLADAASRRRTTRSDPSAAEFHI